MNNEPKKLIDLSKSFSINPDSPSVKCAFCSSSNLAKNGWERSGIKKQRYVCKDCKKSFSEGTYENSKKPLPSSLVCYYCGHNKCVRRGKDNKGTQKYKCHKCGKNFQEKYISNSTRPHSIEIGEDVWDAKDFGLTNNIHRKRGEKINFALFEQLWLRAIVKGFVRFQASTGRCYSTILGYSQDLRTFSNFLLERRPDINDISLINRSVIVDYLNYLSESHRATGYIIRKLGVLRTLFEIGSINDWFELPHHLIRDEDFPKLKRGKLPRYIPQSVLQQLNLHLNVLPEPVMRMVLVIQECGLRVGELLTLSINCLQQDHTGEWSIRLVRGKTKVESIIPISKELAAVIQEQQQYIKTHLVGNFDYLFCARTNSFKISKTKYQFHPTLKVMSAESFVRYLKELSLQFDICDSTGKRWNFQTHQFRHTVATRMINLGVPLISRRAVFRSYQSNNDSSVCSSP